MRFVTRTPRFLTVIGGALMLAIATVSFRIPAIRIGGSEALCPSRLANGISRTTASSVVPRIGSAGRRWPNADASSLRFLSGRRNDARAQGHSADARALASRADARSARLLRRHPHLRQSRLDGAGAGKGARRLRRERQGPCRTALRVGLVRWLRALHDDDRRAFRAAGHRRRRYCRNRAVVASGSAGSPTIRDMGRDRHLHQTEHHRPDSADGARRRNGPYALDLGAHQGKGRVFYSAYGHDQRTWNNAGFKTLVERAIVWSVPEPARVALQQLAIPPVNYVDGMSVPNYENRDPAPKYQLPFAASTRR